VIEEATARAYHPFLTLLRRYPEFRLAMHASGSLLEWLKEHAPATFDLLGELAARDQIELLTGGFYEPIIPVLPDWDKIGQIQYLSAFLGRHFGVHPRGMWLTERVWEPHLPKPLREAGVEYALVDDHHFVLTGLDAERLGGYYLTEDAGASLAVFPISQRLRYLVPFADPEETLAYLEGRRSAGGLTLVDDGEKFGAWPGTHRLVYDERWLARFFEALLSAPWLDVNVFSDYLDRFPPCGRVYLPSASYREMGEWALLAEAGAALEEVKDRLRALPDGECLVPLLRGGFWRNFLVKYPEVNDLHWKMLRLSRLVHEAIRRQPADPRLEEARIHVWRGQGNDAYWHGVFGGCYLPHLRRAVKQALISADRCLAEASSGAAIQWSCDDINGDGRVEITVRTAALSLVLNPESGGSLTEIAYAPRGLDLADVFTRRPEAYHGRVKATSSGVNEERPKTIHDRMTSKEAGLETRLAYDRFRRACLVEGLFPDQGALDALEPWPLALLCFGDRPMGYRVRESPERVSVEFDVENTERWPVSLKKSVRVRSNGAEIHVSYRLKWKGTAPTKARWVVQWNLALTAGEAPGRFYRLPGHPSLGSRGEAGSRRSFDLVDEWADCTLSLGWESPARVAWAPVETVSISEAGFERVYQGSSVLLAWPISFAPGGEWEEPITLTIRGAREVGHGPAPNPR
jgi:alpha-amylase